MRRSTRLHHGNAPQKRHKLAALLVPCMGALFAPSIWAQEAAPAAADSATADGTTPTTQKLERVTVSATRRREPVREVPLRVESLDAESMERAGATSLSDTIGALPGVDVKADSGPGRSAVTMRGVSLGEQTIATVGVYVDEVPFGSSSAFVAGGSMALDMGLLDLHHVELLRGPQGTLYGAGAMGGLLKYVTNEPDPSQFSGKVGVGVRSTQDGGVGHTENIVLNMPLSKDVAALRVAAFNDHEGGYVKATGLAAGDHVNDGNTRGVRASALIEPMTKMKIRLSSAQQEIQRNGLNAIDYDVATGKPMNGDLVRALSVREPYKIKTRLSSADVEYDFGFARLNAVVATQGLDGNTSQDATPFLGGSPAFDYAVLDNAIKLRKQTQELRLTSQRGTVEWLLGYYRDREIGRVDQRLWAKLAGAGNMDLQGNGQPSQYREQAFYGDVTWNIDSLWSLTLGARVARNKQVYGIENSPPLDFTGTSAESSKTYLGTLRYALDKESNVYFRAASGYRPGGPDGIALDATTLQPIPGTPTMFGHDTLWSYELGYKADLLDKRLNIEAALYQINWSDLQQPKAMGISTIIVNAGAAKVRGFELATRYTVDDSWSWNASLAYTDPKLSEDTPDLGPSGTRLANTPKLAYTLGVRYAFSLAGHASYANLNLRHVGQRNAGYDDPNSSIPQFSQPAYTLVDAQWGLDLGSWQLSAFVRNLTNKRAILAANTALTAFGFPLAATVATPRTIGANLSFNF